MPPAASSLPARSAAISRKSRSRGARQRRAISAVRIADHAGGVHARSRARAVLERASQRRSRCRRRSPLPSACAAAVKRIQFEQKGSRWSSADKTGWCRRSMCSGNASLLRLDGSSCTSSTNSTVRRPSAEALRSLESPAPGALRQAGQLQIARKSASAYFAQQGERWSCRSQAGPSTIRSRVARLQSDAGTNAAPG